MSMKLVKFATAIVFFTQITACNADVSQLEGKYKQVNPKGQEGTLVIGKDFVEIDGKKCEEPAEIVTFKSGAEHLSLCRSYYNYSEDFKTITESAVNMNYVEYQRIED